jgi:hypothetical protein
MTKEFKVDQIRELENYYSREWFLF